MDLLAKAATALKDDIGQQMNARPLMGDKTSGDWHADSASSSGSIDLERCVLAVLRAIRSPDAQMLHVGEGYTDLVLPEGFDNTAVGRQAEIRNAWQAMIDHLISKAVPS